MNTTTFTVDAVICDFDNTLVDSETMNTEMFVRFFQEIARIESTEADRRFIDGAPFGDIIHRYLELYPDHLQGARAGDLTEQFLRYKEDTLGAYTIRRATGLDALQALDLPLAIVSGSYCREILAVANAAGLSLDRFTPVLGSDMYAPWKPEPAGLLQATADWSVRAGRTVRPENVAVLEDSPSGLTAARRAGMIGVHITEFATTTPEQIDGLATHTFPTIAAFVEAVVS